MRASRFTGNGEGDPDLALAVHVKTCCSHGASCGGKEFPSYEHRIPRFITAASGAPAVFGKVRKGKNTILCHSSIWAVRRDARDDYRPVDSCNSPIRFRLSLLAALCLRLEERACLVNCSR